MKPTTRHGVPVVKIPYSAAPSAEAAHYPGVGAVPSGQPVYLSAKRKTLIDFRDMLANFPAAWKTKKLDQFVPSSGYYVDADRKVRSEYNDSVLYKLPVLSTDGAVVLVAEEDFDPADEAWTYLAGLIGLTTKFPGRGGTVTSTINGIDNLVKQVNARYGGAAPTKWWVYGLVAVGLLGLIWYGGKAPPKRRR